MVVDLDSKHKRPYETLILGRHKNIVAQDTPQQNNTSHQGDMSEDKCYHHGIPVSRNTEWRLELESTTGYPLEHDESEQVLIDEQFYKTNNKKTDCNDDSNQGKSHIEYGEKGLDNGIGNHSNMINMKPIPEHLVICSVPCQIHSRKPPLKGKML